MPEMSDHMKLCMGCMSMIGDHIKVCPVCGYSEDTPAAEAYFLPAGTVLSGRYILGRVLGSGGFGITYIGYDNLLKQKVTVKEYMPGTWATRNADSKSVSCFTGEAATLFNWGLEKYIFEAKRLAQLNGIEGIVRVYDYIHENNTGYIIMEYLSGKTVRDILKVQQRIPYARAKKIIVQVLQSLEAVHEEGIIHRDIAPDNIFITEQGEVRLLDFGSARYAVSSKSRSLTAFLKVGYTPEEQYRSGGVQGPWTDVYAAGATFYHMITGKKPPEAIERAIKDNLEKPSVLGADIPPEDEKALLKALQVKAADRYQSAKDFERDLTGYYAQAERGTGHKKTEKARSHKGKTAALVGVMIIMAAAGLSYWGISTGKIPLPESLKLFDAIMPAPESESTATLEPLLTNIPSSAETPILSPKADVTKEPVPVRATSGTCGENLTWALDSDGQLTIEGTGPMEDYSSFYSILHAPWSDLPIRSIVIHTGVTSIGNEAFRDCSETEKITISSSVTRIGGHAFEGCVNIKSIIFPASVTEIGGYAFAGCSSLKNIRISYRIKKIGQFAFSHCSGFTSITIPYGVTYIGQAAFEDCTNLKNIKIPASVTAIKDFTFYECSSLETVTIPSGVMHIGVSAFSKCSNLEKVTIPSGVEKLAAKAFSGCERLETIRIPSSVLKIGSNAFEDCNKVTVYGEAGSYAEEYAEKNQIPFFCAWS